MSETGESMINVTSEGGNVIESTSERRGFSIVCKAMIREVSEVSGRAMDVVSGCESDVSSPFVLLPCVRWPCSDPGGP